MLWLSRDSWMRNEQMVPFEGMLVLQLPIDGVQLITLLQTAPWYPYTNQKQHRHHG
jgi:hypothetical protein